MTDPAPVTSQPQRNTGRSVIAVLVGFLTVVVLSLAADQVLHVLDVYPPWGEPMWDPGLNLLALSYRVVYAILGSYIAARLAPHSPMRHAMILGWIGLFFGAVGAIIAITQVDLGPSWYPILLALSSVPCAWLGGKLFLLWGRKG